MPSLKSSKLVQTTSRNYTNERLLCEAMQKRIRVRFRYKDDTQDREFEPLAVYHSPTGKVCVSGEVIANPNDPDDDLGSHNFEVGFMNGLTLTFVRFTPNPQFDRNDVKYHFGIICSV